MNAILISILLGVTAAAANVFGGAIIVQRHWERRYLRYFVALGAGFMLATALIEMVPESLELRGRSAAFLSGKAAYGAIVSGYTYREPALACESRQVMLMWVGSFGIGKASSPALSRSSSEKSICMSVGLAAVL